MPSRVPNYRLISLVVAFSFNALAALWIFADARARRADKPLFAAGAALLLGPLWLAFYMSDRPLRANEQRTGGFGWTWTRNFALAWTASMVPWLAPAILEVITPDALDTTSAITTLALFWLVPIAAAIGIGALVRRPDTVEAGGSAPDSSRVPLAAVSVIAGLLAFLLLSVLRRPA